MKNFFAIIFLVLLSAGLYSLTIRGVYGNPDVRAMQSMKDTTQPFELSPERGRFAHLYSLVENHSYALSSKLANFVYPDVGFYKGRLYSYFGPGISYMAIPFYLLGKNLNVSQVSTFSLVALASIIALIFIYKIATNVFKLPIWAGLAAAIFFAFGTIAWAYGVTLYQHHLTVLFLLSSFYAVWKYKQFSRFSWIWASIVWIDYALAIAIDYPNALLFLPVMVYFLIVSLKVRMDQNKFKISLRPAAIYASAFFIGLSILHGYHNQVNFGSWEKISGSLISYRDIINKQSPGTLDNEAIRQLEIKKNIVGFFSEEKMPHGLFVLFLSPDRSLFLYVPLMLLAILGIYFALSKRRNMEYAVLFACVLVNIFLYGSWGDPWGGWAFGPRYLIPAMAIGSIFIVDFLAHTAYKNTARVIAFALFLYSSAIGLLGSLTTNAVPPKLEAAALNAKYNFTRNIDFLNDGKSASFVYNTFLHDKIGLKEYFVFIYAALAIVTFCVIFVPPLLERGEHAD